MGGKGGSGSSGKGNGGSGSKDGAVVVLVSRSDPKVNMWQLSTCGNCCAPSNGILVSQNSIENSQGISVSLPI